MNEKKDNSYLYGLKDDDVNEGGLVGDNENAMPVPDSSFAPRMYW